jgi:putative SOS response-associated peptidase YedK
VCGRYVRRSDKQRIAKYFRTGETVFDLPPDYNVAPTTFQPVIRLSRSTGERKLSMIRWGLVPSWHKDPKHSGVNAINA